MKVISSIARIAGLMSMGILFLMMLLTVADVTGRALFNRPILGTTEITEQMMVIVVFLGFGWCALQGKHVKVDLFVDRYPARVRRAVDIVVVFIGLALVAVICWQTMVTTLLVLRLGQTCAYIGIPKYPFYLIDTIGWAVLFLAMASLFIRNLLTKGSER